MGKVLTIGVLLVAVLAAGCSSEDQRVDLGPVEDIAGLIKATAQRGTRPPQLVAGASPKISTKLIDALEQSTSDARVVVRVLITGDGEVLGVRIVEVHPTESDFSQQYAQAISDAVWNWQYNPGSTGKDYLDLTFQYPRPSEP